MGLGGGGAQGASGYVWVIRVLWGDCYLEVERNLSIRNL